MGGMFKSCCTGVSAENDPSEQEAANSKIINTKKVIKENKRKKKSKISKEHSESFDDLNKIDCKQANQSPENMNTNINFMEPKTLKLLTSIGEIKNYQQNTLGSTQIEKDLQKHADILARLENPTAFS